MTVAELMDELRKHDPATRVLVADNDILELREPEIRLSSYVAGRIYEGFEQPTGGDPAVIIDFKESE